jgi:hypothetical protein
VHRQCFIRRGRRKLNERWPGYGDLVTDDAFLVRCGHSWPRVQLVPPSTVFAGLSPALDDRLLRLEKVADVACCQAVAAQPTADQREYLELYLQDPVDAAHWARLPVWQRPLRHGDADDRGIWKFYVMQRLNMEQAASPAPPWPLTSQGAQLPQMFGVISTLTLPGYRKLCAVMTTYGVMLQNGLDVGGLRPRPWEAE